MSLRIGFIGLGIMGKPMSKNLLKKGYELTVYDLNEDSVKNVVECGAIPGTSCKNVAENSDIVITMLQNSPHVEKALLGENGVCEGARPGTIIIDMSSINPTVSQKLFGILADKGLEMLDAPVSGGEPKAVEGTLSIMVGGKEEIFNKVKDILLCMGSSTVYVGEIGSGNITKLANQIIVALNIAAMSEALSLATKAGVDPIRVYKAIRGGLAGSTVLDAKAPMVFDRNFKPGFRIELHIKDLRNALDAGKSTEMPLPLTEQVLDMMMDLEKDGMGTCDHSALVRYYEKLAGIEVKPLSE